MNGSSSAYNISSINIYKVNQEEYYYNNDGKLFDTKEFAFTDMKRVYSTKQQKMKKEKAFFDMR